MNNQHNCIYVGNIPYKSTEKELKSHLGQYGKVTDIKLFSRSGYGFITFENKDDADQAIKGLDGQDFKGRELRISQSKYGCKRNDALRTCTQENRIYAGNIPYSCDEDDLKLFFSGFGEVTNVQLVRSREGQKSRGFAFITFEKFEEAQTAIKDGHRQTLKDRKLKVSSAHDKVDYKDQQDQISEYYHYHNWYMYQMYQWWKLNQQPAAGIYPRSQVSRSNEPFEEFGLITIDKRRKSRSSSKKRSRKQKNIQSGSNKMKMKNKKF